MAKKRIFLFDTETTGFKAEKWSILQFGAILWVYDTETHDFHEERVVNQYINTDIQIDPGATAIHGITKESIEHCKYIDWYIDEFQNMMMEADLLVAHNMDFDRWQLKACMTKEIETPRLCTMKTTTNICKIIGKMWYKRPKLQELHQFLFNKPFDDAHDAMADIRATKDCLIQLIKNWQITLPLS